MSDSTNPVLSQLNKAQIEAVTLPASRHGLVLAGAGSGKTRVLVHRLAWLMGEQGLPPRAILAVTFTNKAAQEMKERVQALVGQDAKVLWIGTFHGIAHRMLRQHASLAGLAEHFQILDSDDQLSIIKRVVRELNFDDEGFTARRAQNYINQEKEAGRRSDFCKYLEGDVFADQLVAVYKEYEARCQREGLVDFTELLLCTYEILQNNPEVKKAYNQRFAHILVDEFQDTNALQFRWIKALGSKETRFFVVGDDDQSIYGWRGAKIENILSFEKEFAETTRIKLEQNYRSTKVILKAANSIINQNHSRLGKSLWTDRDKGQAIQIYRAFNEVEEARFIVDRARTLQAQGQLKDIAVLYRSNAQSRVLEEALLKGGIAYRIYGGLRFFERAEIKDALAYLRLVANRNDSAAFERVVNLPARGLGERSLSVVREYAALHNLSMWGATETLVNEKNDVISKRAREGLQGFMELINGFSDVGKENNIDELISSVLVDAKLLEHYQKEVGEKGQARVENLQELVNAARTFFASDSVGTPLEAFLAEVVLDSGEAEAVVEEPDYVHLMTMHAAKGLEFRHVFLCGFEEGLFPHAMCFDNPQALEEERRLCYVGMTRAMQNLTITYAEKRRLKGQDKQGAPSRFLSEMPSDCVREVRMRSSFNRPFSIRQFQQSIVKPPTKKQSLPGQLTLGQRVKHSKFGKGTVLNVEGAGDRARVQVNFEHFGQKWLAIEYAKLEPVI